MSLWLYSAVGIIIDGHTFEVTTIDKIQRGSAFDNAGFEEDDIPLDADFEVVDFTNFYRILNNSGGSEAILNVVSSYGKGPLRKRPLGSLRVRIPDK